ncbi:MAG: hypothetical protein A3H59_02670 [Candidatus Jacksonbacteria bacterium RIFCSPLOWO2_02_FULL_43_9]|nr:MAG: N-acetylglucosaminyldiphosphoundecaprenol N-acetyl-beta-D-mannosaminyltransferase [Parcubacteria group bacterium GW2011_GWA2_43_13]OGY69325.1 MAG: hypothetical protein A3B94_03060 [Candidatus Jacksonbacteria bacterium RIFCSPHIGHO2_02_FULL_43_10]OGY71218.1 MAG: hypothetical protein A2986_00120 [Candidatus Jacksonbacteria bacterium RIFCSPLOWO2_01_FULL_44_13]OGY71917.1 MAG: hypothetical protein A3H59_02670 [Candidatus Jacksonbacteria bacterium RIFCSPLOWO2_02_FULL_43_9]HAZ16803.1 hypothetic
MYTNETDLNRVTNILGLNIHKYSKKEVISFIEQKMCSNVFSWIATINPELCLNALRNHRLQELINSASLSLCDGIGTFLAAKIIHEPIPKRICGSDILYDICSIAEKTDQSILFLGSTESTLNSLSSYLHAQYPKLTFSCDSDILKKNTISYTKAIERIHNNPPSIVCVALGAPYQEEFIAEYLSHVSSVRLAIGIGGALDMIAGKKPRAPRALQALGIEWLWRLFLEPWRIKRIIRALILFPAIFAYYLFRMHFCYRKNVLGCIMDTNKNILIIERSDTHGHWQLPQGGIERGERIYQAFLREMHEELGLNNFSVQVIVRNFFTYPWPKWHQLNRGYHGQKQSLVIATLTPQQSIILDPSEVIRSAWVKQTELIASLHPVRKEMASQLIDYLSSL